MRIFTIIGRVLDPQGIAVNRRVGRIFVNREVYIPHPADQSALEAALRIKDATGAEVIALPRGLFPDADVLRQALSAGADRAVYLTAAGLEGSDAAAMTRILTAAIERLEGGDLLLLGSETLDSGQSQLGPRLAEALGWPQITSAWDVQVNDGRLQAVGQQDGDYVWLTTGLPAVVTVRPGALKLRYPDGARLVNVYRGAGDMAAALKEWNVTDLVDADDTLPALEQRGREFPAQRELGVRAKGSIEEMAQTAADALRERVRR
jgi:electron transfer flavoprotein beta subunit